MLVSTTILWEVADRLDLSPMEYVVMDSICHLSKSTGWCYMGRVPMAKQFKITKGGLLKIIQRLEVGGLLDREMEKGHLRPTETWTKLYLEVKEKKEGGTQSIPDGIQSVPDIEPGRGKQSVPNGTQSIPEGGTQSVPNISILNKEVFKEEVLLTPTPLENESLKKNEAEKKVARWAAGRMEQYKIWLDELKIPEGEARELVLEWLEYKATEKHQYYGSIKYLKTFIEQLNEFSGKDFNQAKRIIKTSIANTSAGIYPVSKSRSNGKHEQTDATSHDRAVRIAASAYAAANGISNDG